MMLPNKTISYNDSVISKFPLVLELVKKQESINAGVLYKDLKKNFSSIHVFVQTLDCLFALGKIKFNENEEIALC